MKLSQVIDEFVKFKAAEDEARDRRHELGQQIKIIAQMNGCTVNTGSQYRIGNNLLKFTQWDTLEVTSIVEIDAGLEVSAEELQKVN